MSKAYFKTDAQLVINVSLQTTKLYYEDQWEDDSQKSGPTEEPKHLTQRTKKKLCMEMKRWGEDWNECRVQKNLVR